MAENTLNKTPASNRTHIVFLGKMNSGKSSLINALADQNISIVSDKSGTTTDAVKKSMEIHGIGPCVLVDTAGFDDRGELGDMRVKAAKKAAAQADIAVLVISDTELEEEKRWCKYFEHMNTPVIAVVSKCDIITNADEIERNICDELKVISIRVSSDTGEGIDELKKQLVEKGNASKEKRYITGNLVREGDVVMLVMPQDIQAPEGRLILPQVQTTRELLDKKCIIISITTDRMQDALDRLKEPPKLIITDSQVYKQVYQMKPKESKITSFSTLFAAYKGDIHQYVAGAGMIGKLTEDSKVLIAECCTHAPLEEDIGREKIPALLRKKIGGKLTVDVVSGTDFPDNLADYDLIIQCGACMFNRKYVMSRLKSAREQRVPITNYGIAIAWINGILENITIPD